MKSIEPVKRNQSENQHKPVTFLNTKEGFASDLSDTIDCISFSAMESQRAKLSKKISEGLRTSSEFPIPLDLIPEILKASTVQTLARFLCVSKEYKSIIRNRDFMKSYLIKSSTRPQSLIFTFKGNASSKHFFFSASHPQNQGESSSSSSSSSLATYYMKCHAQPFTTVGPSVHGLICYGPSWKLMVHNPSTKKTITLPSLDYQKLDMHHYLGYDPINGDYKVLCMMKNLMTIGLAQDLRVLTLGKENSWRIIEDFPSHNLQSPDSPDICIDGVLYYVALLGTDKTHAIMSFDVRSEKLNLIKGLDHAYSPKLTNYKGKLAFLFYISSYEGRINLWVLKDAAKHEWSKKLYVLPTIQGKTISNCFHPFCATAAGELVLARQIVRAKRFYVLYYHPKKNSIRRVYIEGINEVTDPLWDKDLEHSTVSVFSGYVDNLMFL